MEEGGMEEILCLFTFANLSLVYIDMIWNKENGGNFVPIHLCKSIFGTLIWELTCGRPPASVWPPGWPPDHRPAYRGQLNIPNVLVEFAAVEHT